MRMGRSGVPDAKRAGHPIHRNVACCFVRLPLLDKVCATYAGVPAYGRPVKARWGQLSNL